MKTHEQLCGKEFTTVFCLFVAFFFVQSNMIGGGILHLIRQFWLKWVQHLVIDFCFANSPTILGGPVQMIFQLFILAFQLAIIWTKKK